MIKFIYLTALLLLTRVTDLLTTYCYTPDLKKESNPLVLILGFGWTGIILVESIGLAIIIYALWVYSFKTVQVPKYTGKISMKNLISLFYFGDQNSFLKLCYKLPTIKNSLLYSTGYIITYSLIGISILISCSTSLLLLYKNYQSCYAIYYIPALLYSLCILIPIFFSIRFFKQFLLQPTH